jgi:hypothetical protein
LKYRQGAKADPTTIFHQKEKENEMKCTLPQPMLLNNTWILTTARNPNDETFHNLFITVYMSFSISEAETNKSSLHFFDCNRTPS